MAIAENIIGRGGQTTVRTISVAELQPADLVEVLGQEATVFTDTKDTQITTASGTGAVHFYSDERAKRKGERVLVKINDTEFGAFTPLNPNAAVSIDADARVVLFEDQRRDTKQGTIIRTTFSLTPTASSKLVTSERDTTIVQLTPPKENRWAKAVRRALRR